MHEKRFLVLTLHEEVNLFIDITMKDPLLMISLIKTQLECVIAVRHSNFDYSLSIFLHLAV